MCNLYAYRGTRPDDMKNAARNISQNNQDGFAYVIGPHNEAQLVEAAALVEDVVFAYGNIAVEGRQLPCGWGLGKGDDTSAAISLFQPIFII